MRTAPPFLDVARTLAVQAARRIHELSHLPITHTRKADRSLVTNIDKEADVILREGLHKAFPEHAILTEESGLQGSAGADFLWLVDPLDGTSALASGRPGYSVMVGLLKEGKPFAGVVVDPVVGHIFEAERGQGSFHTLGGVREQLHVSLRRDLAHMPVITSSDIPPAMDETLRKALPGQWVQSVSSVGIKVGILVREIVDIYINHRKVHCWDTCAPQIILEEAGGTFTFADGSPVDYSVVAGTYRHTLPTLASNGPRHRDIVQILKPLW